MKGATPFARNIDFAPIIRPTGHSFRLKGDSV
jgi:hypothetical protein